MSNKLLPYHQTNSIKYLLFVPLYNSQYRYFSMSPLYFRAIHMWQQEMQRKRGTEKLGSKFWVHREWGEKKCSCKNT